MREDNKAFLAILKKVKLRMTFAKAISNLFFVLAIVLTVEIGVYIISRFVPIYNVYGSLVIAVPAAVFIVLITAVFKRASLQDAALKIDSMGLKERTVTSLELIEEGSAFAELQRSDAYENLKSFNYKQSIKLTPSPRYVIITGVLALCLIISAFIPNPMKDIAFEKHRINQLKKEEINKIKKVEKEVAKNEKLTPIEKNEVEKKLTELKQDLKEAKSEKEINKAIEKTDKKLELVKEKYNGEDLKKISEALAKNEATKSLADIINNGDKELLKEGLKQAAQEIKNLSPEQLKALAENLSKLSKELMNNEELRDALGKLSQKLAGGQLGDINEEMGEFASSLQELMNSDEFKDALAQIQSDLKEGQNEGEGGSMSAQGSGQGNQGGSQPGGNQPGQGNGGSGTGSGTDKGQEDQTPTQVQTSGLNKKESSEKKNGEYEKIFTPKTLGGEGEKSQITGKKNTNGNTEQVTSEKGLNVRGEDVPYNQVIGSYKQRAVESMGSSEIPEGMREIIKNYFTSLEE